MFKHAHVLRPAQESTQTLARTKRAALGAAVVGMLAASAGLATNVAGPVAASAATDEVNQPTVASQGELIDDLSTATSNTYINADGSRTVEVYTAPVNYQDPAGDWRAIDNTLVAAPGSAYAVQNAANDYKALIPQDASSTPVKFVTDGGWITMKMEGADSAPSVTGATATFNDVQDADSVTYSATNAGLKENIELDAAPGASDLFYTYKIDASAGLTAAVEDGAIEFRSADGDVVATIPTGNMIDAGEQPAYTENVDYRLATTVAGWKLTVTPDMAWLRDPNRVYPVTIDPSIVGQNPFQDCWIRESAPSNSACGVGSVFLKAGRADASSRYRSLLNFDLSTIPTTAIVSSASIELYLDSATTTNAADYALYPAGKDWADGATWNSTGTGATWTGGNPGSTAYGTRSLSGTANAGYRTFDGLAPLIQGWVYQTNPMRGLVLKQVGESVNNILSFVSGSSDVQNNGKRPHLDVTYNDDPSDSWNDAPAPTMTSYGVDSDVLDDLQYYATQQGITLQKAVDLYGWQDTFNEDVEQIAATYPDTFSSAEMNPDGLNPSAEVIFTSSVPPAAAQMLSNLPITATLSTGALYTDLQMQDMLDAASASIVAQTGDDAEVVTEFDDSNVQMTATVYPGTSTTSATTIKTAARTAVSQSVPAVTVPDVNVTMTTTSFAEPTKIQGGGKVFNEPDAQGMANVCTSGFPAKTKDTDVVGVITAAHCADDLKYYEGGNGQRYWSLSKTTRVLSQKRGDIQFNPYYQPPSPLNVPRTDGVGKSFYYAPKKTRRITGTAGVVKNALVCMFGRTTMARMCGTIKKTNTKVTYAHFGTVSVTSVRGKLVSKGDSGGPVFRGGKAIGIISGYRALTPDDGADNLKRLTFFSRLAGIKYAVSDGGMNLVVNY